MKKIIISYYEDFRKSEITSEIYSKLRDNGLNPYAVFIDYTVENDLGIAFYIFKKDVKLPNESKLLELLEGINFNSLEIN